MRKMSFRLVAFFPDWDQRIISFSFSLSHRLFLSFFLDNYMIYGGMCRVIWRLAKLLYAANKMYHMPYISRAPIISSTINRACWLKNVLRYRKGLLQNTTICYILSSLYARQFILQPVSLMNSLNTTSRHCNLNAKSKDFNLFKNQKFLAFKIYTLKNEKIELKK